MGQKRPRFCVVFFRPTSDVNNISETVYRNLYVINEQPLTCYKSHVTCCKLYVLCCTSYVIYCILEMPCILLWFHPNISHMSTCHMLHVIWCISHITCHSLHVLGNAMDTCMLYWVHSTFVTFQSVICHMWHVTCHISHVTCNMPHVTSHVSHVTCRI